MIGKCTLRRVALTGFCVALFGQAVYASPAAITVADPLKAIATQVEDAAEAEATITFGTVVADVLNVREQPGTDQNVLGKLYYGEKVRIGVTQGEWHYITTDRITGWVHGEWVTDIQTVTESQYEEMKAAVSAVADDLVAYAKLYLGKPYRAGGKGPDSFDCSGFVSYVYKNFGYSSLPASSSGYMSIGTTVSLSEIQVGDIMCFTTNGRGTCSHVGIYVGDGQVIHASTGRRGVVLDSIYDSYYSTRLLKIVRI